jgi:hypothetical protein
MTQAPTLVETASLGLVDAAQSLPARAERRQLLTPGRRRAIFHGLVLAGLVFFAYVFLVAAPAKGTLGFDIYAYWSVRIGDPYHRLLGDLGFFAYSPPAAVAFAPLTVLSWPAAIVAWWVLMVSSLVWLGGRSFLVLLAFPPVAYELYHGNIHLLLAVAIVFGFRYPWAWAVVLLTKITCGVGLLWFVARREWRQLAIALGTTAAIVVVTFVLLPQQWLDWLALLATNAGGTPVWPALPIPLWLRLPIAAAVVWWGALRDERWTVPLAATIAVPVVWVDSLAILAACWPLRPGGRFGKPVQATPDEGAEPLAAPA